MRQNLLIFIIFFINIIPIILFTKLIAVIFPNTNNSDTIFISIFSIFTAIYAYFYKNCISYKKSYLETLLKCKWILQQNQALLELQQTNPNNITSIMEKLELIPPYLEHYSTIFDDNIRNTLILYNAKIIELKININVNNKLFSDIDVYQKNALWTINQQIDMVNILLKNPLLFYLLPQIFDWISKCDSKESKEK